MKKKIRAEGGVKEPKPRRRSQERSTDKARNLFESTRRALCSTINRMRSVAGDAKPGGPHTFGPLSVSALAERTGIARSNLTHLLSAPDRDDDSPPNPDLRSLCRLAEALEAPPAWLLMRAEDWTALLHALTAAANLLKEDRDFLADVIISNERNIALAESAQLIIRELQYKGSQSQINLHNRTIAVAPPYGDGLGLYGLAQSKKPWTAAQERRYEELKTLFVLCTCMGAFASAQ